MKKINNSQGSKVTCDDKALPLQQQNTYIPLGSKHRCATPARCRWS